MSRMNVQVLFALTLIALLALAGCTGMPMQPEAASDQPQEGEAVKELHVLNWQGYGSDEPWAIEQFEEMYDVKVVHDYFNSEDELLTKLRTSPGTYDVVLPNIAYVPPAIADGLLAAHRCRGPGCLVQPARGLPDAAGDGERRRCLRRAVGLGRDLAGLQHRDLPGRS